MIAFIDDYHYCTCDTTYRVYDATTTGTAYFQNEPCPIHNQRTTWVNSYALNPDPKETPIPKWWWYFETFGDLPSLYSTNLINARTHIVKIIRRIMFHKSGYLPKRIRRIKKSK